MTAFHNDLLFTLYETVHKPESWRGFLDQICDGVQVRSAVVQRVETGGATLQTTWLTSDSHSEEYASRHALVVNDASNPRMRKDFDRPIPPGAVGIACDEDLAMPAHVRRRFQDDLGDVGLGKGIFASMDMSPTAGFSLILHRHAGDSHDYSAQERDFLAGLMPHLSQAILLSDKLNHRPIQASGRILDLMRPPLLVCDAEARLVWANTAGGTFLRTSGGLKIIAERLSCPRHDQSLALHNLIRMTVNGPGDAAPEQRCLILDGSGQAPIHVVAMPLPGAADGGNQVGLFLSQADMPFQVPARVLEKLFRLSPAESRLAKAIVEGGAVNSYALQHGLAEGTVRFQLKQILAKTGCPRQSDLVRLICSTIVGQFSL